MFYLVALIIFFMLQKSRLKMIHLITHPRKKTNQSRKKLLKLLGLKEGWFNPYFELFSSFFSLLRTVLHCKCFADTRKGEGGKV
jgi:hypothetical protein